MMRETQNANPDVCQAITNSVGGAETSVEKLRRQSIVFLRRLVRSMRSTLRSNNKSTSVQSVAPAPVVLHRGDLVRVRTYEEIKQTLDNRGYTKGCKFMTQMVEFCDQELRVAGNVDKFFDEARCRTLRCKNIVLLEDAFCNGAAVGGCDRMCFLFWRTEWLELLK